MDEETEAVTRFIEIQLAHADAPRVGLELSVGDVLKLSSTGARVLTGHHAVELLGIFTSAAFTTVGTILTPLGAPNVVLFRATEPGESSIEVMIGDPWHAPRSVPLSIRVSASHS